MNKRRDDETEPMTRMLGTIVSPPPRASEPHKRLVNVAAEQTRLEIARPTVKTGEPPTQIIHRTAAPPAPALSLDTKTVPNHLRPRAHQQALPEQQPQQAEPQPPFASYPPPQPPVELQRDSPPGPIRPVFAPRLSQADQDEITASRAAPNRKTPFLLAVALVVVCFATGAQLLRVRAAKRRAAAMPPAAAVIQPEQAQPEAAAQVAAQPAPAASPTPPPAPQPETQAVLQPPAPEAVAAAPAIAEQADTGSVDELEKRAVDRLQNNDHEAALEAYRELSRRLPKQEAYSVMVTLLTRRVRACQGDPSCTQ